MVNTNAKPSYSPTHAYKRPSQTFSFPVRGDGAGDALNSTARSMGSMTSTSTTYARRGRCGSSADAGQLPSLPLLSLSRARARSLSLSRARALPSLPFSRPPSSLWILLASLTCAGFAYLHFLIIYRIISPTTSSTTIRGAGFLPLYFVVLFFSQTCLFIKSYSVIVKRAFLTCCCSCFFGCVFILKVHLRSFPK